MAFDSPVLLFFLFASCCAFYFTHTVKSHLHSIQTPSLSFKAIHVRGRHGSFFFFSICFCCVNGSCGRLPRWEYVISPPCFLLFSVVVCADFTMCHTKGHRVTVSCLWSPTARQILKRTAVDVDFGLCLECNNAERVELHQDTASFCDQQHPSPLFSFHDHLPECCCRGWRSASACFSFPFICTSPFLPLPRCLLMSSAVVPRRCCYCMH